MGNLVSQKIENENTITSEVGTTKELHRKSKCLSEQCCPF